MAELRALLAAERKTRQVSHPLASYDKSGALSCVACDLKIPAEKLWEPHLRSANHRKNALAREESRPVSKKRKIGSDSEDAGVASPSMEAREKRVGKRTKSVRFALEEVAEGASEPLSVAMPDNEAIQPLVAEPDEATSPAEAAAVTAEVGEGIIPTDPDPVDEDEWAAFERDLATLTRPPDAQQPSTMKRDDRYASATISAPAMSAADLAQRQKQAKQFQPDPDNSAKAKRRDYEAEAQEEREDEEARIADEFAVMEEMEEKVRRLKEMREIVRTRRPSSTSDVSETVSRENTDLGADKDPQAERDREASEENDEEDDLDDWFS